jgi:uncharacterized protein YkwD
MPVFHRPSAAARRIWLPLAAGLLVAVVPGFIHHDANSASAQARSAALANCDVDASRLPLEEEEQAVLNQTNAYRAAYSLQPLQLSYSLTVNAEWKAIDMAANHYGDHDDGFRTWDQRFRDCGYNMPNAYMGENLAGGNASGVATLQQWETSPHHNENLLNPNYSVVGIKRVKAPDPTDIHVWYWAMELASDMDVDLYTALTSQPH